MGGAASSHGAHPPQPHWGRMLARHQGPVELPHAAPQRRVGLNTSVLGAAKSPRDCLSTSAFVLTGCAAMLQSLWVGCDCDVTFLLEKSILAVQLVADTTS